MTLAPLSLPAKRWSGLGATLSYALARVLERSASFPMPALRVLGMERAPVETRVEVQAVDGVALATGLPGDPGPQVRRTFAHRPGDPGQRSDGRAGARPSVRVVRRLDLAGREWTFEARCDLTVPPGAEPSFRVGVQGGEGLDVRAQAEGARVTPARLPRVPRGAGWSRRRGPAGHG